MKKVILLMCLTLAGCHAATSTTPPAAIAPGYNSTGDQTLGQSLAAVNYFMNQEKTNYATLPSAQQAAEKTALNALITATDLANAAYTAYHAGTATMASAQSALTSAQNAQTVLAASKGVK